MQPVLGSCSSLMIKVTKKLYGGNQSGEGWKMGAWGYSVFDNDAALDVLDRWKDWVESPTGMGYEHAIEAFFNRWGDAVKYGDLLTNCEIIALLGIHLEKGIKIPERLRTAAITAISLELEQAALNSWAEPEKRKSELEALLERINAKPKKVKKPFFFRDPTLHYKDLHQAKSALLELSKDVYQGDSVEPYKLPVKKLPPFLQMVKRVKHYRLDEKDQHIADQAFAERNLMLAWYAGIGAGLSREELESLMDKVIKKYS
jgi:hypothetical protein